MKSSRARSGKSAAITNSRWLAYATAGAASAFASAPSAEGTIHYSGPINQIFKFYQTSTLQLDQPGDSIRLIHSSETNYLGHAYFGLGGRAGAAVVGFYNNCDSSVLPWAFNLQRGQVISFQPLIPTHTALLVRPHQFCNGQFNRAGLGYIGFKFNNGSGDQYGWVRIQTHGDYYHNFILRDYAYGDMGDQIRAGQTSSNEVASDKGSLGWLALGAVGLLAWRKGQSKARQAEV